MKEIYDIQQQINSLENTKKILIKEWINNSGIIKLLKLVGYKYVDKGNNAEWHSQLYLTDDETYWVNIYYEGSDIRFDFNYYDGGLIEDENFNVDKDNEDEKIQKIIKYLKHKHPTLLREDKLKQILK